MGYLYPYYTPLCPSGRTPRRNRPAAEWVAVTILQLSSGATAIAWISADIRKVPEDTVTAAQRGLVWA